MKGGCAAHEVVRRRGRVVVQVVAEVEAHLVEALARHEGAGVQAHAAVLVDVHDAQAQPFVQHHARADVAVHARHQGLEGQFGAFAGKAGQGPRLRRPRRHTAAAPIHCATTCAPSETTSGTVSSPDSMRLPQAADLLAMHAGHQAHAAVRRQLVVEPEIPVGHLDEQRLQQFAGVGEGHAAREHELHQRTQRMAQRLDKRARWRGVGRRGVVGHGHRGTGRGMGNESS